MYRTLARNIIANWSGFLVHAAVTFFLTPFVLRELGETRYGVWVLAISIVGHYGVLDIGLRGATTFYLTRYLSVKDYHQLNITFSSVFTILTLLGGVIGLLSLVIGLFAPRLFEVPPEIESEIRYCIVILGIGAAIQIALFPFEAVLTATQRFDLSNLIAVTVRVGTAVGIWASLMHGHGLLALAMVIGVGNLVGCIIEWRVAYRLVPQLRLSVGLASWANSKELFSFGGWQLLNGISISLSLYSDSLIVGLFLPLSAVTVYGLAANMAQQIGFQGGVMPQARGVFGPAAIAANAEGDRQRLRRLYLNGSRLIHLILVVVTVVAGVWAGDFYQLWIGGGALSDEAVSTVTLVFRILLGAVVLQFVSGTAGHIIMAAGRIRLLASLAISESTMNLVLNIILVQSLGVAGVAVATFIATLLFRVVVPPWIAGRQLSIPLTTFISETWTRPLLVGICLGLISLALRQTFSPQTWLVLIAQGMVAITGGTLLCLFLGLRSLERREAVDKVRKFVGEKLGKAQSD